MIDQSKIAELKKLVVKGDYTTAATMYREKTGRTIDRRHLQKFIQGQFTPSGRKNAHSPIHMFAAVADAVKLRQQKIEFANTRARQLLAQLNEHTEGGRQGTRKRARTLAIR